MYLRGQTTNNRRSRTYRRSFGGCKKGPSTCRMCGANPSSTHPFTILATTKSRSRFNSRSWPRQKTRPWLTAKNTCLLKAQAVICITGTKKNRFKNQRHSIISTLTRRASTSSKATSSCLLLRNQHLRIKRRRISRGSSSRGIWTNTCWTRSRWIVHTNPRPKVETLDSVIQCAIKATPS